MKGFLDWALYSPWRVMLLIALGATLPLLSWLSWALIALVTLTKGIGYGARFVGAVLLIYLLPYMQQQSGPLEALLIGQMSLGTVLICICANFHGRQASWLRTSLLISGAGALVALVSAIVLTQVTITAESGEAQTIAEFAYAQMVQFAGQAGFPAEQLDQNMIELTISQSVSLLVILMPTFGLVLGRYWQGILENPGGFGREFRDWRINKQTCAVLLLLATLPGLVEPMLGPWLFCFGWPLFLQALSIVHSIAKQRQWQVARMVIFYLLIIFLWKLSFPLLMLMAATDSVVDFRQRYGASK